MVLGFILELNFMGYMKRNKYFLREKEWIRAETKSQDLLKSITNQAWVKLDKPIQKGWLATWEVRKDILKRKDGWVYKKILELVNTSVTSRRKDFKYKPYKTKHYITLKPGFKKINSKIYDSLHPQVKRHFNLIYSNNIFTKYYQCDISYEFIIKISKNLITHYQEHNEILEQEYSEEKYKINNLRYSGCVESYYTCNPPKWYRNYYHKSERKVISNKLAHLKNISSYDEDYDISYTRKNDWW